ncbi:Valine-tRNA ligase [Giardia muris]|uniref:valine--tRNA ligase n=1 Tax=Giardia muris TaxID=5742 RepID=A0A4Z1SVK8_GIAMU|nr:Valine-tRNA ligase [Giardia muris]|eukprot:TNJ27618.1 Valine-tRNA ligase [Giardia muris]
MPPTDAVSGKLLAKANKAQSGEKERQAKQKTAGKAAETVLKTFVYDHPTAPGEKKVIAGAWPDAYNPDVIEPGWYAWWEAAGFFRPECQPNVRSLNPRCRFSLIVPPPNVTGSLHVGHALTAAVQDALVRWRRMLGYRTVYLPGLDHAGIATQTVVERELRRAEGLSRHDIGRAAFLERAWAWKEAYGSRILTQLRRLGSSLDWSRTVFTLDEERSRAHDEAFVTLFDRGLVYRDTRLVNWDCALQTAISDVEVEYLDIKKPVQLHVPGHDPGKKYPFGWLWHFTYKAVPSEYTGRSDAELQELFEAGTLKFACSACEEFYKEVLMKELDTPEPQPEGAQPKPTIEERIAAHSCSDPGCLFTRPGLTVATTRPETIVGDTAVCIHPADERYAALHGQRLFHPVFPGRTVPVVCDDVLVDMAFGTGCVKVTPAHDPNDFECGKRHGLEFISILEDDGRLVEKIVTTEGTYPLPPGLAGQRRFDGRIAMLGLLRRIGLYRGRQENPMAIGTCQRSRDIVEPILKPQWYIDCTKMAERALRAVVAPATEEERLLLVPEHHIDTWRAYLENIRPWCISRQLWWGHQIPCYLFWFRGEEKPSGGRTTEWVAALSEDAARARALALHPERAARAGGVVHLQRDEDVTDTWFSSALLPFTGFADPADRRQFFPGSVLETGHDILFFWVARMVMLSLELQNRLPFREVYLHALVRDAHGEKMSKTKGNVIDPIDVIQGISAKEMEQKLQDSHLPQAELTRALKCQRADFPRGIATCGADALRLALCASTGQGRSVNLDVNRVVACRNFCNKLFNAVRFGCLCSDLGDGVEGPTRFQQENLAKYRDFFDFIEREYRKMFVECAYSRGSPEERLEVIGAQWILSRLHAAVRAINSALREFRLADACTALQTFWHEELCDIFLELAKPTIAGTQGREPRRDPHAEFIRRVYYCCLDQGLRLAHPFLPFLTEELFQHLPRWNGDDKLETIMYAAYPTNHGAYHYSRFGDRTEAGLRCERPVVRDGSESIEGASVYRRGSRLHSEHVEQLFIFLRPVMTAMRALRGQYGLPASTPATFHIACDTERTLLEEGLAALKTLCNAEAITFIGPQERPARCGCMLLSGSLVVYMELVGVDLTKEVERLDAEIAQTEKTRQKLLTTIASLDPAKIPEEVRQQNESRLQELEAKLEQARTLRQSYLEPDASS